MRCFSTKSVSLATFVAISFLLVNLSTSADEAPVANDPFGDVPATQSAPTPPVVSTADLSFESAPALRFWADDCDPRQKEHILEILDSKITSSGFDFQGEPLESVVAFLRDEYPIEIQLDRIGLDDLGIGPDEPITVKIRNVKLGSALRLMLKPLEMNYAVQNGILIITSEDEALTKLSIAVYPVEDLLADKPDWDALIDTIVSTVETETWAENGGGDAEVRPYPQRSALVVLQTTQIHEKIAALLAALRECHANHEAKPLPAPKPFLQGGGSHGGGYGGGGGGGGGQF